MKRLYCDLAALQMRLALVKLALKYNPSQPRVPAGNQDGGRWTTGWVQLTANDQGESGIATDVAATSPAAVQRVILPNGQPVANPYSRTGYLVSPVADLKPVAEAGRQAGTLYQTMLSSPDPDVQQAALPQFLISVGSALGQGGAFDYQRSGSHITGFIGLPEFRDVSNFNVGLYMQQTGQFSEDKTLSVAGIFAQHLSSNYMPDQPYGLDPRTAEFIRTGYRVGASDAYGKAAGR